ncbi:MAG TPA: hypothetical protein PKD23_06680 [Bellilinea sp.]|nr:hypothetical protein [Bellilinea sp.]
MSTLANLVVKLIADVSEFSSSMDAASKKLTAVGDDLMKIGGIMTATATVPLVALGKSAVDAASDLEETKNKTMTIFDDMSGQVLVMGENAASAMGMSNQQALDYASTIGSLLDTTGLATDQVTDMSIALTQLTADYASFHNLSPEEAFEKIKAGMVGSSEPLLSIGKNLQQAQVEAYAAANGIGTVGQQLTQGELALARYGLLMSQSTNEMGDFSKTSDGLANSTRISQATLTDVSATMGQELLPVALEFMKALIPILQGFNNMDPATRQTVVGFLAVVAAAGPLITGIGGIVKVVGTVIGLFGTGGGLAGVGTFLSSTVFPGIAAAVGAVSAPVLILIAAVAALIAVIVIFGKDAWNSFMMLDQIRQAILQKFADFLSEKLRAAIDGISGAISDVIGWIGRMADKLSNLKLPSWLTPGSPTPFELGLRGINKEMKRTAVNVLPSFAAQIESTPPDPLSGGGQTDSSRIATLLEELNQRRELDEFVLARALRDAMVQVMG